MSLPKYSCWLQRQLLPPLLQELASLMTSMSRAFFSKSNLGNNSLTSSYLFILFSCYRCANVQIITTTNQTIVTLIHAIHYICWCMDGHTLLTRSNNLILISVVPCDQSLVIYSLFYLVIY